MPLRAPGEGSISNLGTFEFGNDACRSLWRSRQSALVHVGLRPKPVTMLEKSESPRTECTFHTQFIELSPNMRKPTQF
jgi:hypothetical protein